MEFAVADGGTSRHVLGLGLAGTRRLGNAFEIESTKGVGTRVVTTLEIACAYWKVDLRHA
jgi:serine/threonine-protein kinase RsbT